MKSERKNGLQGETDLQRSRFQVSLMGRYKLTCGGETEVWVVGEGA